MEVMELSTGLSSRLDATEACASGLCTHGSTCSTSNSSTPTDASSRSESKLEESGEHSPEVNAQVVSLLSKLKLPRPCDLARK